MQKNLTSLYGLRGKQMLPSNVHKITMHSCFSRKAMCKTCTSAQKVYTAVGLEAGLTLNNRLPAQRVSNHKRKGDRRWTVLDSLGEGVVGTFSQI